MKIVKNIGIRWEDLKDGIPFKCTFRGVELEGKIAVSVDGWIYLCHNNDIFNCWLCPEIHGFKYSHLIQPIHDGTPLFKTLKECFKYNKIKNFQILNRKAKLEQLLRDLEDS